MKTAINQDELRRANDVRVMEMLRTSPRTRRELQAITGLSWGGITNTVNRLADAGYIVEKKTSTRGSGRNPALAALRNDDNFVIGLDVNHTGLSACVTSLGGDIISESRADADFSSPVALLDCIESFAARVLAGLSGKHVMAIGLSMQGEVDTTGGISLLIPQCAGWKNVPICDILSHKFSKSVFIAHDPDCMLHAYMESTGATDAVLMRLDRSVGLAAAVNGRLIQGAGLMEAAHMVIDPRGPRCSCGMRGCLNAYVAACESEGAFASLAEPLAVTAHNMIQLFRPREIILAGELMENAGMFMDEFGSCFAGISCHAEKTEIKTVSDARLAMRGAALIAAEGAIKALDIREKTEEATL